MLTVVCGLLPARGLWAPHLSSFCFLPPIPKSGLVQWEGAPRGSYAAGTAREAAGCPHGRGTLEGPPSLSVAHVVGSPWDVPLCGP